MSQTSSTPYDESPSPSRESLEATFRVLAGGVQVPQVNRMSSDVKDFLRFPVDSVFASQPMTETSPDTHPGHPMGC